MTRLLRFGPVLSACLSLGACAQLIGLDKFDDNGAAEAGKGGSGGAGGSGGSAGKGQSSGGNPGAGGSTAGKGGTGGTGGTTGGAAGESGASPTGGTGGNTNPGGAGGMEEGGAGGETGGTTASGGTGGSIGSAGAGAGGESTGCSTTIEIVTHGIPDTYDESKPTPPTIANYQYVYNIDPQIGSFAIDYLNIVFYHNNQYNGDLTGSFQLGQGDEENYATCARCVYIDQDYGSSGAAANFFAASGTMNVAADSRQMSGHPDVEFTDVLFREATIDFGDTDVSTYVPNGRCLHLSSAHLTVSVPTGWTCTPSSYGGGDECDCGCGIPDPDCTSALVGACYYCDDTGSCASDCSDITLSNNATCTANQSWTCDPLTYGDGQTCDCGCGIVDVDCASASSTDCGACGDPNACTATLTGSCTDIDTADNSKCK